MDSLVGCSTQKELKLIKMIREYREKHNLSKIPISTGLTKVADVHVRNLIKNKPHENGNNCNMHSWSDSRRWSACCHKPDHSSSECMWEKLEELTDYTATGYVIAYRGRKSVEATLKAWKQSSGHNAVILKKGDWRGYKRESMGVGKKKDFAVIWFGSKPDSMGKRAACD